MDILEANFPGLLSRSAPQPNAYHPVSPVSSLSDDVLMSRDNFARPINGDGDGDVPGKTRANANPQPNIEKLRSIFVLTLTINDEEDLTRMQECLGKELPRLHRLLDDKTAFATPKARSSFFRSTSKKLKKISKHFEWQERLLMAIDKYERAQAFRSPEAHLLASAGTLTYPWIKICSNTHRKPSTQLLRKMVRDKTFLLICKQKLPQGALLIMQQWLREVDRAVDEILVEVEEDARREVIMQQRASLHAMRT
ncbi:hypothetical protein LTR29_010477 [Friedmanniomyces endolithicus]|nr:hypothetical protein LTR29_010477 [Friedmanniomyces endolithicus]